MDSKPVHVFANFSGPVCSQSVYNVYGDSVANELGTAMMRSSGKGDFFALPANAFGKKVRSVYSRTLAEILSSVAEDLNATDLETTKTEDNDI